MSGQSIPIIICGRRPDMASAVKKGLEPEVEVIHVVLSVEAGEKEIPSILRGEVPGASGEQQIGTGNYSDGKFAAVVLGGGYDDAMFNRLRAASKGDSNVPWLRLDHDKPGARPLQPGYQERVLEGVKECLERLKADGRLIGDGVYYY